VGWSKGKEAVTGARVHAPACQRANASTVSDHPGVLKFTHTLTLSPTSNTVKETTKLRDQPSDNSYHANILVPTGSTAAANMGAWGYGESLQYQKTQQFIEICDRSVQSDHDFDIVSELSHDAGLTQMEEEAQAAAKAAGKDDREVDDIYYSVYRQSCSNPELVRKHLDSGALVYLVAEREAAMLAMPSKKQELEHYFRDPCYIHVLLGACAMTLGCQIPNQYISMLKMVYTEGGLMPDALKQMKKALKGPHGYQNGEPYDFESKDLVETANAMDDTDKMSNGLGFIGMKVLSPGGLFDSRTFKTPG
jgi:hypothetical protein